MKIKNGNYLKEIYIYCLLIEKIDGWIFDNKILAFTKGKFMFPPCQPPIQEKQHHKSSVACTSTAPRI